VALSSPAEAKAVDKKVELNWIDLETILLLIAALVVGGVLVKGGRAAPPPQLRAPRHGAEPGGRRVIWFNGDVGLRLAVIHPTQCIHQTRCIAMRLTMEASYLMMKGIVWSVEAFFMSASWIFSELALLQLGARVPGMVGCTHVNTR
jgi:hypothetical protein